MDNQLTAKGWYLSDEGLKACQVATGKENATANDIINVALNSDLRQIARKQLPENINTGQVESVNGPLVLQIQKVRNVSAPLANQDSKGAPRMLKFNLTDGCNHCVAIEFDNVSFLNMNIIPGTKVCLVGSEIQVVKGCILMTSHNIKILGGEVEVLKAKWEASKQVDVGKRYGKIKDDPPPAFTEFDGTRKPKSSTQRRNTPQDVVKMKDEKSKGTAVTVQKQPQEAKRIDQKSVQTNQEKKVETSQKKDRNNEKKDAQNDNEYNRNDDKNEYNRDNEKREYNRNNDKSEYKRGNDKREFNRNNDRNEYNKDNEKREYNRNNDKNEYTRNNEKREYSRNNEKNEYSRNNEKIEYNRNNEKGGYKTLWSNKNQSGTNYKDEDQKVKTDTLKEKKVHDKETPNWDKDSKSSSSSLNYKDKNKEKNELQHRNVSRPEEKQKEKGYQQSRDQQKTLKSYDTDKEKKTSQDYRVREKKVSNERQCEDEFDRKIEKRKSEKDLWHDDKPKDKRGTSYESKKGKGGSGHVYDDQRSKSSDSRDSQRNDKQMISNERKTSANERRTPSYSRQGYSNEKEVYRDGKIVNKEGYTDRGEQRGAGKGAAYADSKKPYVNKSRDNYVRDDRNYSNNDRGRRDRGRDDYDSRYDKNTKTREQSSKFKEKKEVKNETKDQYDGDKSEAKGNEQQKKPVAYDASSQNWFYDGEMKNKRDNSQYNDTMMTVTFKNDGAHYIGNNPGYQGDKKYGGKKTKEKDFYNNDYRDEWRYGDKEQKRQNYKQNDGLNNRDQHEEIRDQGKADNKKSLNKGRNWKNTSYNNNYNNYRDKGRTDYNEEDFKPRRRQSNDSRTSKGSKDNTPSINGHGHTSNDKISKTDEQSKLIDESNSQSSPGRRIPLEVLFGKSPSDSIDKELENVDGIENITKSVANLVIPDQSNTYQAGTQYGKRSTKEIMERSLEQGRYNQPSQQDMLYMQFSAMNQLTQLNQQQQQQHQQQIPYYQQTLQPCASIPAPSTSQYIGYSNEHTGGAGGGTASTALNPYLSFPTSFSNSQENFRYNQIHTQHGAIRQQLPQQQQQTQNVGNDVPYYSNSPYYYQLSNSQLPSQLLEQYQ